MSKAKLEYARELIQEKRYEEARTVLRAANHPTAAKWLRRLDKIAPSLPPPQKRRKSTSGCWVGLLIVWSFAFFSANVEFGRNSSA